MSTKKADRIEIKTEKILHVFKKWRQNIQRKKNQLGLIKKLKNFIMKKTVQLLIVFWL